MCEIFYLLHRSLSMAVILLTTTIAQATNKSRPLASLASTKSSLCRSSKITQSYVIYFLPYFLILCRFALGFCVIDSFAIFLK
jgi:hypothetical protein